MIQVRDIKIIVDKMGGIGGMFQRHAITNDKKVYTVYPLDIDEAKPEDNIEAIYMGDIQTLEIEKVKTSHRVVMDAIEVYVYEVIGEEMKLRYKGMEGFDTLPKIATETLELANTFKRDKVNTTKIRELITRRSCRASKVASETLGGLGE